MTVIGKRQCMKLRASSVAGVFALVVVVLLFGCSMAVPIAIIVTSTVTSPKTETITFDHADDIVVAPNSMMQIAIGENFDSYAWVLDGVILPGQTSATVDIDCTSLSFGVHHVSAFVTLQGKLYSKTLRFRIEN